LTIPEIHALLAHYPAGVTARALALQACGPDTGERNRNGKPLYGFKVRAFTGFLGMLAARGEVIRRGNLYFPRARHAPPALVAPPPAAPPLPPPGWYATEYGPRWWDGQMWR
jgi:hypothetical protein